MVGLDYHSPENEDFGHDDSAFSPEPSSSPEAPGSDQIVQIDFSSAKSPEVEVPSVNFQKITDTIPVDAGTYHPHLKMPEDKTPVGIGKTPQSAPPVYIKPPASRQGFVKPLLPAANQSGTNRLPAQILEDLNRAAAENQRQIQTLSTQIGQMAAVLPKLNSLEQQLEHSNKLESVNQKLFDTMHTELKGYKDGFLFESLQKPITRDLLVLFDDLCGQSRRMARFISDHSQTAAAEDPANPWEVELRASRENVNNTVHSLMEIFNRMTVVIEDGQHDFLDLKLHKVVGIELTTLSEEQNSIVKVVRPGFFWRERLIRPTEVIVRKLSPSIRRSGKR